MAYSVELSSPPRAEHDPNLPTWSTRAPVRIPWTIWSASLLGLSQILLSTTAFSAEPSAWLAMLVVGAMQLLSTLYSLIAPRMRTEYVHMLLGLVLVSAPVICGFTGSGGPAAACWVLGGATIFVGLAHLPPCATDSETESTVSQSGVQSESGSELDLAEDRWPTRVDDLTTVTAQPAGRHHAQPAPESDVALVGSAAPASRADGAAPALAQPKSPSKSARMYGSGRKLDPQQVERIRAMAAETSDDGKRRYSVSQMASEFGVARSTIYRHLKSAN